MIGPPVSTAGSPCASVVSPPPVSFAPIAANTPHAMSMAPIAMAAIRNPVPPPPPPGLDPGSPVVGSMAPSVVNAAAAAPAPTSAGSSATEGANAESCSANSRPRSAVRADRPTPFSRYPSAPATDASLVCVAPKTTTRTSGSAARIASIVAPCSIRSASRTTASGRPARTAGRTSGASSASPTTW
jgi:hypothetical protein